jgi:hypothetical protein
MNDMELMLYVIIFGTSAVAISATVIGLAILEKVVGIGKCMDCMVKEKASLKKYESCPTCFQDLPKWRRK